VRSFLLCLLLGCTPEPAPVAPRLSEATALLPADAEQSDPRLRIGYFHGGRNVLLYRAWIDDWFDKAGVRVVFRATHRPDSKEFHDMPRSAEELETLKKQPDTRYIGRTTGVTIVGELKKGGLDCGMIGESSFLLAVDEGLPYTAVAKLGQDTKDEPGKIVVVRSDLEINSADDLIGKSIGSRESGPYDMVMTREFVLSRGLRLDQMQIIDQIPQHPLKKKLQKQQLDLAFLHLHIASKIVARGLYKPFPDYAFDFAEPGLSQALLVCKNTVIAERRDELVALIRVYKRRIDYEQSLSQEARRSHQGDKTRGMELRTFKGLNLPQYDPRPVIDPNLLQTMQGLLLKHGVLTKPSPIGPRVDNSLVLEALAAVEAQGQ
jgi:ABC-type nitrate/sulfonate/bicarbonate transport system substrate-binding protein